MAGKKSSMFDEDDVGGSIDNPIFELRLNAIQLFVAGFSFAGDRLALKVMASRFNLDTSDGVDGWVYGNDHCLFSKQRG